MKCRVTIFSLLMAIGIGSGASAQTRNLHMGTGTHFAQGWDAAKILPLIADSGVGWIRDDLNWSQVERTKGSYVVPPRTLEWIKAAHAHGLKLDLILNGSNRNYENPYDPDAYARCAAAMAVQLKDDVDALEILNEPANFGYTRHYGGTWNGVEKDGSISPWLGYYVTLLNKAAEAIKAVNPRMKVIGLGSVTPVNFRQLAMGVSPAVDGIVDHPYPNRSMPELIPFAATESMLKRDGIATADILGTFVSQIRMYREISEKHHGPKEIWLTEFGYTTYLPKRQELQAGFTPSAQAKYLQRRFLLGLALGIDVAIQYDFKEDGVEPSNAEHHFGLVNYDLQPKPAYHAVQRLALATAGFKPRELFPVTVTPLTKLPDSYPTIADGPKVAAPGAIPVYGFEDEKGRTVIALWSAERADGDQNPRLATVKLETSQPVSRIVRLDLMTGEQSEPAFQKTPGAITLELFTVPDYPVLLRLE